MHLVTGSVADLPARVLGCCCACAGLWLRKPWSCMGFSCGSACMWIAVDWGWGCHPNHQQLWGFISATAVHRHVTNAVNDPLPTLCQFANMQRVDRGEFIGYASVPSPATWKRGMKSVRAARQAMLCRTQSHGRIMSLSRYGHWPLHREAWKGLHFTVRVQSHTHLGTGNPCWLRACP